VETRAIDCPPCETSVPITCLGAHETGDWPCHAAKAGPCGRNCGRQLACGNHTCSRDCHRVKNAPNDMDFGSNCRKCESHCLRARPTGCAHPCSRACHQGACAFCTQMIRVWCHCGLSQLYVKCGEWTREEDNTEEKETLACCKNQCPKTMQCGHR
jgi:NF-X1-type zinc finger protein NFXL1